MGSDAELSRPATRRRTPAPHWRTASIALGLTLATIAAAPQAAAQAQTPAEALASAEAATPAPAMEDTVYRGRIHYPDFAGRDRVFAKFRTRIRTEMRSGPNFAGHYAIVEIGCGAGCLMVYVADVANGQVFDFPYGGDRNYTLALTYTVKEPLVEARWLADENTCMKDTLKWDGATFASTDKRVIGDGSACTDQ